MEIRISKVRIHPEGHMSTFHGNSCCQGRRDRPPSQRIVPSVVFTEDLLSIESLCGDFVVLYFVWLCGGFESPCGRAPGRLKIVKLHSEINVRINQNYPKLTFNELGNEEKMYEPTNTYIYFEWISSSHSPHHPVLAISQYHPWHWTGW